MFARVGGKSKSKKMIINRIPPHKIYVEPFVGGGSIFFSKPKAEVNVINDKDKDVYHLYSDMKDVGDKMIDKDFTPTRTKFFNLLNKRSFSSKVERLYRNLYVSLNSFAGDRKSYLADKKEIELIGSDRGKKYKTTKWKDFLQGVKIHNSDYKTIIQKYDSKDTFFFLDPPYSMETEKKSSYSETINIDELVNELKQIRGKFLMTYDDTPSNRKLFKGFKIKGFKVVYELSQKRQEGKKEIMIQNY